METKQIPLNVFLLLIVLGGGLFYVIVGTLGVVPALLIYAIAIACVSYIVAKAPKIE